MPPSLYLSRAISGRIPLPSLSHQTEKEGGRTHDFQKFNRRILLRFGAMGRIKFDPSAKNKPPYFPSQPAALSIHAHCSKHSHSFLCHDPPPSSPSPFPLPPYLSFFAHPFNSLFTFFRGKGRAAEEEAGCRSGCLSLSEPSRDKAEKRRALSNIQVLPPPPLDFRAKIFFRKKKKPFVTL